MNVDPIGDWILVNKATNDHARDDDGNVLVYKTGNTLGYTNWVEIVDVGERCVYVTKAMCNGKFFIQAPHLSNDMKFWKKDRDTGSEFFFIRESFLMNDKANRGFVVEM